MTFFQDVNEKLEKKVKNGMWKVEKKDAEGWKEGCGRLERRMRMVEKKDAEG